MPFEIRTLTVHCTPQFATFEFVACHRNFVFAVSLLLWLTPVHDLEMWCPGRLWFHPFECRVGPTSDGSVINFLSLWCVGLLQIKFFPIKFFIFLPQIVGLKDFSCLFKDFYSEKLQESYYWLYSVWNGTHSSFCKTLVKKFHREMLKCKHNCSVICNIFSWCNMCVSESHVCHKELYNYQA